MAFATLPCTQYAECESTTLSRWNRTTLFGGPVEADDVYLSTQITGSLFVTADARPGVTHWSAGLQNLVAAPGDGQTAPTLRGGDEPALSFHAESCALRDATPTYATEGIAGALTFSTRPDPPFCAPELRSAQLRFAWGGGDAGVELDTEGPVLSLRVAGATVALPAAWMAARIVRYTLAWRVVAGTMTVRLLGGPSAARTVLGEVSGPYPAAAAAALPAGGAELSGRWIHVYALRWWPTAPSAAAWATAVTEMDTEWRWTGTVCNLTFLGDQRDRMMFLPPPDSSVVGAWQAEAPDTAAWRLCSNFYTYTTTPEDSPTPVDTPRPGLLCLTNFVDMEPNAFIHGHDSAGLVVLTSDLTADPTSWFQNAKLNIMIQWRSAQDAWASELDVGFYSNTQLWAGYHGGDGWVDVINGPAISDEAGGQLHALGWTIKDRVLNAWYVSGPPGARSVATYTGTFTRTEWDDNPEPDVTYYLECYHAVIHEVRLVSPAPSIEAWNAVVTAVDQKWSAV